MLEFLNLGFGYGDLGGAINIAIILLVFVFLILLVEYNIRKKNSSFLAQQTVARSLLK